jgi:hypothetical protein
MTRRISPWYIYIIHGTVSFAGLIVYDQIIL